MGYKDMFVKLKITTFLMSFALLFNIAYSETNLDSLLNLLKKEKSITGKTSFILQIAKEYLYTDPEKSKLYLNRAKKLIKSSRDKNQKALYTLILGNYYYVTAKYDSAIETLTRCYRLAERIGIQDIYIRSLNIIAVIHARAGEYSRSNKILKELLQLSENKNDSTNLLRLCSNLATNYLLTEKPDSAAIWYEKALKYTGNNNFYKAAVEVNLANLNVQVGNYSKAREYALSAINHVKSRYDEELYLEALTNIVNSYLGEKNYDKAIEYCEKIIPLASEKHLKLQLQNAYRNLSLAYEGKMCYKKALNQLKKYLSLHDEIFSEQMKEKVSQWQAKYENERKEKELVAKNAQIRLKNTVINFLIGGMVLISGFSGIIAVIYYKKRDAYNKLVKKTLN